jgi:hypothetical protein
MWRVALGSHSTPPYCTHSPPGKIVYSKWYRNSEHATFEDVFKTFLKEAGEAGAAVKVREGRECEGRRSD